MIPNTREHINHRLQYLVRKRLGFRAIRKITKFFFYFVIQPSLPISPIQKYTVAKHDSFCWLGARNIEGTQHVGLEQYQTQCQFLIVGLEANRKQFTIDKEQVRLGQPTRVLLPITTGCCLILSPILSNSVIHIKRSTSQFLSCEKYILF